MKPKPDPAQRRAVTAARIEAALRASSLGDRERVLLGAYMHFESIHGGACGQPGVCWPTDGELADYLGKSVVTIRRARRALSDPASGAISITYVPPFGAMPDGSTSWHGSNVVRLREVAMPPALASGLGRAAADVERLERELAAARRRLSAAALDAADAQLDDAPANDDGGTQHNAPSPMTPEWSSVIGGSAIVRRVGEPLRAA